MMRSSKSRLRRLLVRRIVFEWLRLENFKSHKDTGVLSLRPLTLIVGPNNAGKSSLLQSIVLLKQTLEDRSISDPLITAGPFLDLGSFHDILRGGTKAASQTLTIEFGISQRDTQAALLGDNAEGSLSLSTTFALEEQANRVVVEHSKISLEEDVLIEVQREGLSWNLLSVPGAQRRNFEIEFLHFVPHLQPSGKWRDGKRARQYWEPVFRTQFLPHSFGRIFSDVRYVAPLRLPIPRYSVLGKMPAQELGAGGENLLRVLRSDEDIAQNETLIELVDDWMSRRLGMLRKLRFKKIDRAGTVRSLLGDERDGFPGINIANMGQGISQLLPIVAAAAAAVGSECFVVEQPEIHLHPAAQSEMADLFVDGIRGASTRQFIVETHSEHLLLRIRRRIAEGVINPRDVAVLYVDRAEKASRVRQLDLTRSGSFKEWPEGFFEEGYQEALKLVQATPAKKRR